MTDYKPQELDKKWQARWTESRAFEVEIDSSRPKFYCLEMFAYPSGHAHVGHVRNYIIGDICARMKRMQAGEFPKAVHVVGMHPFVKCCAKRIPFRLQFRLGHVSPYFDPLYG